MPGAVVGGDPRDGERLRWLSDRLNGAITRPHLAAAESWRRDVTAARDIAGIRGPWEQPEHRMPGTPPDEEAQKDIRHAYHMILARLATARSKVSACQFPALVRAGLEMTVLDNVVPEMMLTRQQAVDALVAGLSALTEVYGEKRARAA